MQQILGTFRARNFGVAMGALAPCSSKNAADSNMQRCASGKHGLRYKHRGDAR